MIIESIQDAEKVIDGLSFPAFINIKSGENRRVNQSYLDLLNVTIEDVVGDGWRKFIHPNDSQVYLRAWEQFKASECSSFSFPLRLLPKGLKDPVRVVVHAFRFPPQGGVSGWMGYLLIDEASHHLSEARKALRGE